jgi:glycine cleavage system H protein
MSLPEDIKYTEDHEWAKLKDDILTIGITDFAQSELGDIIFVEFPDLNIKVSEKDSIGTLEAVKTVADIYSPISGEIIELNNNLENTPELINEDPYNDGWILKIKINNNNDYNSLLTNAEYQNIIK